MSNQPTTLQHHPSTQGEELAGVYDRLTDEQTEIVKYEAFDQALSEFDQLEALNTANDDDNSPFHWDNLTILPEEDSPFGDSWYFSVRTGVDAGEHPTLQSAAHDFARVWVEQLKDELREHHVVGGDA